ncbi:MAG: tetraacyldisaccharide 4'-kinase [Acidobacteriota bacterium]|nr:tetraacyldisaccharide 4'-kinase [Acidobacteriota bacterium]
MAPDARLAGGGPWQWLAGSLLRARRNWYRAHARRLPVPVISIGNLHLGGTGKTPLTAAIASHLHRQGNAVTILSRGYRRRTRGVIVASVGEGLKVAAEDVGDEPALLAEALQGVAIVVGERRYDAGQLALAELDPTPEVFVLDDGFSHVSLARDVDILTFPAADPLGSGKLAPNGPLREPLAAALHADAAIVTDSDNSAPEVTSRLKRVLEAHGFTGPVFTASSRVSLAGPRPSGGLLLVSGIARPDRVAASAASIGLDIREHLVFPDHHAYPSASLEKIRARAADQQAHAVVTTAKDAVKLRERLTLDLITIETRAELETAFWEWLDPLVETIRP